MTPNPDEGAMHDTQAAVALPYPDAWGLALGEVVVGFVEHVHVRPGDRVALRADRSRPPEELKPAYQDWADRPLEARPWTAEVVDVLSAGALDPIAGDGRHLLAREALPDARWSLLILRVQDGDRPMLSQVAFDARVGSLRAALDEA